MSVVNQILSLAIGRRTRVNVLEGKTIRKHKDGGDVFEDYWTDSDEKNSNDSSTSSPFFSSPAKSQDASVNKRQISIKDLSVEEEQIASVSDDNYFSSKSKRKQLLELNKIKIHSSSRKNKQKSISAKSCSDELQQFPVNDLSSVPELPLNKSNDSSTSSPFFSSPVKSQDASANKRETSIKDLSVEEEQIASVSDDNYSSSKSKRKQLLELNKIKIHSSSRKNKQKSISAKSCSDELQQFPVNDLSPVPELPLNKSFDNLHSLSNKEHTPEKSAKRRKKSYSKEQVRRSSRQRYAPFARWRNERLLYRFEKGKIKILGVDKGFEDDDAAAQQIERRRAYERKRKEMQKKENIPRIEETEIFDTKLQKQLSINVYKAFLGIPWVSRHNKTVNNAYRIKRTFETNNSAFGYLEIGGFEKKPTQHIPDEDLQLTVVQGEVEIIIQENSFKPQKRDIFIIPRGIPYSIKNINKRKALLSFSVGKFKLLEKGE